MEKAFDLIESFSGIRGIYGKGITEELLKKYFFAYFEAFPQAKKKFLLAGDTRASTNLLKLAAISFLKEIGVKEIIDAGVVPIQTAELAVLKFGCLGGFYITASHNEPNYNGWKMLKQDGAILYANQAQQVIDFVNQKGSSFFLLGRSLAPSLIFSRAVLKEKEAIELYCNYVLEKLGEEAVEKIKQAKLKVLFDPNGGSAIEVLKILSEKLNLQANFVNDLPGKFNRLVEPKAESLAHLQKYFEKENYEFATGFDTDADRVEFMTQSGLVNGNYVLALACDCLLQGAQNQVVVTNDVTSYLVRDVIKKHKAIIKEVEVGETNVVQEMEKQNSLIGGEGSNGGVIIPPIKCRDGLMTTCLFLKMIAQKNQGLSDILQSYPKYFSSHNKATCLSEKARQIKNQLESYYKKKGYIIKKTGDDTGGLKAEADENSYIWFRLSKTEPGAFRIYAETDQSQQKADNLAKEALAIFMNLTKLSPHK